MTQTLNLNRKIYSKKAIEAAIAAFGHLAEFKVSRAGDYFRVSFSKIDEDVKEELHDEFSNFVLAETQNANSRA